MRKKGWYWVKWGEHSRWEPAHFDGSFWRMSGLGTLIAEPDVISNRIREPKSQPSTPVT